jgi:hypothetical protein
MFLRPIHRDGDSICAHRSGGLVDDMLADGIDLPRTARSPSELVEIDEQRVGVCALIPFADNRQRTGQPAGSGAQGRTNAGCFAGDDDRSHTLAVAKRNRRECAEVDKCERTPVAAAIERRRRRHTQELVDISCRVATGFGNNSVVATTRLFDHPRRRRKRP